MQHCAGSWVYLEIASQLGLICSMPLTTNIGIIVSQRILKKKFFKMTIGNDEIPRGLRRKIPA